MSFHGVPAESHGAQRAGDVQDLVEYEPNPDRSRGEGDLQMRINRIRPSP